MSDKPTPVYVTVPKLQHDAMMASRFGTRVSADGRIERRVVANLLAHLERAGFAPLAVYDGDDYTKVSDAVAAMELIFNLDEASLRITRPGTTIEHGILLVLGNGEDIISDWNFTRGDPDGFSAAMDAFDVAAYAVGPDTVATASAGAAPKTVRPASSAANDCDL
ncbi:MULTISPECIES: hypothetical protein [Cupriavidus]